MTNKQDDSFPFEFTDGLTRRELFAAFAFCGLLANPDCSIPKLAAPMAAQAADLLISALDSTNSTSKKQQDEA